MTVFCRYHCRSCDRCFVSLVAFDAHRTGTYQPDTRRCTDPAALTGFRAMVRLGGVCRISQPPTARPRVVWRLQRDVRA